MLNAKNIHIQPDKTLLFAYIVQILPVENPHSLLSDTISVLPLYLLHTHIGLRDSVSLGNKKSR